MRNLRALVWRMRRIESMDLKRSTRPHGIAEVREYDRTLHSYEGVWGVFATVEAGDDASSVEWLTSVVCDRESYDMTGRVVVLPFAHLSSNLATPDLSYVLLDSCVTALRRQGLSADRISFGTSKWLKWDVSASALKTSYVASGRTNAHSPELSGMFLKLRSISFLTEDKAQQLSNLVAVTYSSSSENANQFIPDLMRRLETLERKRFYQRSNLMVIPLSLGQSACENPSLSGRITQLAESLGWNASELPTCERIIFELAGQPADASYFEFPRQSLPPETPSC